MAISLCPCREAEVYFGVEYSSQKGAVFGSSWQVGNYVCVPPHLSGTESDRDGAMLCMRPAHLLVFNITALFPRL